MASSINALLESYPRSRPPLTPRHEALYLEEYRRNRSGSGGLCRIVAGLEAWMHRSVARAGRGHSILELGAGTLNHIPYEPMACIYDAVEPFRALWESSPHRRRIRAVYDDIDEVPKCDRYDRVISIAVLEHLTDLPYIVARSAQLLAPPGQFQAGFPSEGGLLWGLAWRCTTGLSYRLRNGLPYATVMRHEHVNSATEILDVLRYFFDDIRLERFPLRSAHLSFYTCVTASQTNLRRCQEFCQNRRVLLDSASPNLSRK